MALSLKRKGFNNVTIFEKTSRVGGKSFDVNYHGITRPMGTVFGEVNYFDNLFPLAKEFGVGDIVKSVLPNVWATNNASDPGSKLTSKQFILGSVAKMTKSLDPMENAA